MKTNRFLVVLIAVSSVSLGYVALTRAQCPPLKDADKAKLVDYVHKKYSVPATVQIRVDEAARVGSTCYRKLEFKSQDATRKFRIELYASPDLRFLTRELLDSLVDPAAEERKQHREVTGLTNGNFPVLGPPNAPITVTIFSDFECPYCARFASMMRSEILPSEGDRVRLVFRHLPLSMHPWARAAAEAAACAFEQKNEFFWSFHDFFFEHQRELTSGNLRQKILEHAHGLTGLDRANFESCSAQKRTAPAIEHEVAFANDNGIHATPTVFLNGKETRVVAAEQLRTLIRQLSPNPRAPSAAVVSGGPRFERQ